MSEPGRRPSLIARFTALFRRESEHDASGGSNERPESGQVEYRIGPVRVSLPRLTLREHLVLIMVVFLLLVIAVGAVLLVGHYLLEGLLEIIDHLGRSLPDTVTFSNVVTWSTLEPLIYLVLVGLFGKGAFTLVKALLNRPGKNTEGSGETASKETSDN